MLDVRYSLAHTIVLIQLSLSFGSSLHFSNSLGSYAKFGEIEFSPDFRMVLHFRLLEGHDSSGYCSYTSTTCQWLLEFNHHKVTLNQHNTTSWEGATHWHTLEWTPTTITIDHITTYVTALCTLHPPTDQRPHTAQHHSRSATPTQPHPHFVSTSTDPPVTPHLHTTSDRSPRTATGNRPLDNPQLQPHPHITDANQLQQTATNQPHGTFTIGARQSSSPTGTTYSTGFQLSTATVEINRDIYYICNNFHTFPHAAVLAVQQEDKDEHSPTNCPHSLLTRQPLVLTVNSPPPNSSNSNNTVMKYLRSLLSLFPPISMHLNEHTTTSGPPKVRVQGDATTTTELDDSTGDTGTDTDTDTGATITPDDEIDSTRKQQAVENHSRNQRVQQGQISAWMIVVASVIPALLVFCVAVILWYLFLIRRRRRSGSIARYNANEPQMEFDQVATQQTPSTSTNLIKEDKTHSQQQCGRSNGTAVHSNGQNKVRPSADSSASKATALSSPTSPVSTERRKSSVTFPDQPPMKRKMSTQSSSNHNHDLLKTPVSDMPSRQHSTDLLLPDSRKFKDNKKKRKEKDNFLNHGGLIPLANIPRTSNDFDGAHDFLPQPHKGTPGNNSGSSSNHTNSHSERQNSSLNNLPLEDIGSQGAKDLARAIESGQLLAGSGVLPKHNNGNNSHHSSNTNNTKAASSFGSTNEPPSLLALCKKNSFSILGDSDRENGCSRENATPSRPTQATTGSGSGGGGHTDLVSNGSSRPPLSSVVDDIKEKLQKNADSNNVDADWYSPDVEDSAAFSSVHFAPAAISTGNGGNDGNPMMTQSFNESWNGPNDMFGTDGGGSLMFAPSSGVANNGQLLDLPGGGGPHSVVMDNGSTKQHDAENDVFHSWQSSDSMKDCGRFIKGATGGIWRMGTKVLGAGSYGKVYLGLGEDGIMTAIKELNATEPGVAEEIEILKKVIHENVVKYYDVAMEPEKLSDSVHSVETIHSRQLCKSYIVMEYVAGGSLYDVLKQFRKLTISELRPYLRDILSGLDYLHSLKITHRDVKPHNVLVTPSGRAKLSDFGISRVQYQTFAPTSKLAGTPAYLAPECLQQQVSATQDVWAVGVTVLHLLTGKMPWVETGSKIDNPMRIFYELMKPNAKPPIPPKVPNIAVDFINLCCTYDPCQRPSVKMLLSHPLLADKLLKAPSSVPGSDSGGSLNQQLPSSSHSTESVQRQCSEYTPTDAPTLSGVTTTDEPIAGVQQEPGSHNSRLSTERELV